jgi:hypothetical protein
MTADGHPAHRLYRDAVDDWQLAALSLKLWGAWIFL